VVQEAYVRAWECFGSFHGGESRAWLLTIVRHTCYTWLQHNRAHALTTAFDEAQHGVEDASANPETWLLQRARQQTLHQALEALPVECREVVVLRELEGLSYKEIAAMTKVPLRTVMSRLARARKQLQQCLAALAQGGPR
jgi:RNA polymerase sigma-70 factor (ECF subfamily)